jgi:hypothetical protein
MAIRAIIHFAGEEAILCEMEEMPKPSDTFLLAFNPRRKDGKPIPTLADGTTSVIFPISYVTYVEFFEERTMHENVVGFFRESGTKR